MENDFINITNADLEKLSLEELADLKIELDNLVLKVNDMGGHVYSSGKANTYKIVCKLSNFFKIKKILEEKDSA